MKFKFLLLSLFTLITLSPPAFGGGTGFSSIFGAKTTSLNGLYFAGTDGVVTAFNNPAGLIFLEDNVIDVSIIDQLGQHRFTSAENEIHRSYRNDDFSVGGGISMNFGKDFSAALVYAPVTDYRVGWPFLSFYSNDSLEAVYAFRLFNRVQINSVTTAAAMRFGDISVGVAANIYFVNFNPSFPVTNERWDEGLGVAAYQFEYKMDAVSYGFTLGVSGDINENIHFGAVVRSGYTASLEGDASSNMFADLDSTNNTVTAAADLEMPWTFGAGVVYMLNPDLRINIDAEYKLWGGTASNINFDFGNSFWQSGLASPDSTTGITGSSFSFANDNALRAGIGIEYYPLDYLVLRGGYRFSQTYNKELNYNFLFPNVSSHAVSVGFGLTEENLVLDAAVMYAFGIEKDVQTGQQGSTGKYNLDNIVPMVSLRYLF